jgi:hypothetical protein
VPADEEKKTEEISAPVAMTPSGGIIPAGKYQLSLCGIPRTVRNSPSRHSVAQTLPQTESIGYGRQETNADPNS